MPTVIAAPMLRKAGREPYKPVSAIVQFNEEGYIVSVAEMAAVDAQGLTAIGNLLAFEYEIRRAIDGVFLGF